MARARRFLVVAALLAAVESPCWGQSTAPKPPPDAGAKSKEVADSVRKNSELIEQNKRQAKERPAASAAPSDEDKKAIESRARALIGSTAAKPKQVTPQTIAKLYTEFLTQRGLAPQVSTQGNVNFSHQGRQYSLNIHEDRPEVFQLVSQGLWKFEGAAPADVVAASVYATGKSKCAKVILVDHQAWVSVEMYVLQPDDFTYVFDRAVSACDAATQHFVRRMNKLE